MTFIEAKCMIRMMYVAITSRGVWGGEAPYSKVLPTTLLHLIFESELEVSSDQYTVVEPKNDE